MSKNAVAVLEPGYANYKTEEAVLEHHGTAVVAVKEQDDAVSSLKDINPVAVMVRERTVSAAEMETCPNLKVIVRYGVGVDNIDLDYARGRGIYVANVPNYGAEIEVSEHAVALYLAVQRRIVQRDRDVRNGQWGIGEAEPIPGRFNAVLGLIGCGRIGLEAAHKFKALGFKYILAFDPFLDSATAEEEGIELVDIDTLCAKADVITLHAPLNDHTRHILNRDRIDLLKPSSIVVNVSRGGLVDEQALADALNDGRIFGAGIDVFEQEPIASDNPLLQCSNTVISDHTAWYSERSVGVLQHNAAMEINRVLQGGVPQNWVNKW
ncbi:C-terminal binding protein [Cohaesibacter intestini]|uniref:C-terminal binding protein n=1 Tax=Cohaesibacter intestini TaxID=2211145 RepID=UPI000DE9FD8B|nr:C-terminal binding protein [Cohaesibacter intestini]